MKNRFLQHIKKCDKRTVSLLLVTALLVLMIGSLNPESFFSLYNFKSMTVQLAEIGIYGLALFTIVVSGGLNLSIVAIANFSAICGGCIMQGLVLGDVLVDPTARLIAGILVSLVIGMLSGIINGYFVAGLGLAAVLVTSATSQLFQGMALVVTKGSAIVGAPDAIMKLGTGTVGGIIPYLFILVVICYGIVHFIFEYTAFGEQCRLLGANATANKYSGNSNFKTLMKSYILSGLFSAVGGLVSYSRMCALRSDYGNSLTSTAMLVVLMGGAYIVAGGGRIVNIFIALFSIQIISSGMTLAGTSNFTRNTIWGFLLVGILLFGTPVVREKLKKKTARAVSIKNSKED